MCVDLADFAVIRVDEKVAPAIERVGTTFVIAKAVDKQKQFLFERMSHWNLV